MIAGRISETQWAAVVVNRNAAVFLDGCLHALYHNGLPPSEVVVVDNASTDDSVSELAGWPQVIGEALDRDIGFPAAANRGLALTTAPIVVVLMPEVTVEPGFGAALIEAFDDEPPLGAAAVRILNADRRTLASAGGSLDEPTLMRRLRGRGQPAETGWDTPAEVGFAPSEIMALRRKAVDEIGGFDELFLPGDYADADLCTRLRDQGWRVRYLPSLVAVGFGRADDDDPANLEDEHRGRLNYALKHLRGEAWWGRFVPGEIERLRSALAETGDPDWPATTGAGAIEALARVGRRLQGRPRGLLSGDALSEVSTALAEAQDALAQLEESASRTGRLRGRRADYAAQSAFNRAVLRALEAQDRMNREIIADLLLAMLAVAARPAHLADEPDAPEPPTSPLSPE